MAGASDSTRQQRLNDDTALPSFLLSAFFVQNIAGDFFAVNVPHLESTAHASLVTSSLWLSERVKPQVTWVLAKEQHVIQKFMGVFQHHCQNKHAIFVDSGANDGMWSLLAAAHQCTAVAVDPQLLCLNLLAAAAYKTHLPLQLHQTLLSDQSFTTQVRGDECSGTAQFPASGASLDAFDFKSSKHPPLLPSTRMVNVSSSRLDKLIERDGTVVLWHIDVEGAEIAVLRSAKKLFRSQRIKRVMLEWVPERWHRFGVDIDEGIRFARNLFRHWKCLNACHPERGPIVWSQWRRRGSCADIWCVHWSVRDDDSSHSPIPKINT